MEPLTKARVKLIQSLQHKKFRQKYDKFIVEGLKITRELITEQAPLVEEVYVSNPDYMPVLREAGREEGIYLIAPQQMHQISQMTTPPGVMALCHLPKDDFLPDDLTGLKIFYLDAIRDPGNLGTIIRTADWFGLDYVLMSADCVDVYNHKVLQASMGSAFRVKTAVVEKSDLLALNGTHLYVCDMEGKSLHSISPPDSCIIILGNESLGVSGDIMHQVTDVISIPGDKSLGAESLNVASAAAIVAYWLRK